MMKQSLKISSGVILAVFILLAAYFFLYEGLFKKIRQIPEYAASIEAEKKSLTAKEGERVSVVFNIKNKGKKAWSPLENHPCLFSYHLLDAEGKIIRFDNPRYTLPQKVKPSQSIELTISLRSPLEEGVYQLEFDLVREGAAWFEEYGSPTLKILLTVTAREWPEDKVPFTMDHSASTKISSSRDDMNKIFRLIRLTLQENEVFFQGKTGEVRGFSAGKDYPQIWIRDANTIIPAAKYFYGTPYLSSWLEEHLAFQSENGSLADWIDSKGNSGKNTTETDQESSAVQAAYQIAEIIGPKWLEKEIFGEKIINRLERALLFVLHERFDKTHGLLKGAHTADWGDVDLVDNGEQAVDTDERTHWTVDIYDQAMFYQACQNLKEMLERAGRRDKANFWRRKAESIKINTNKWLWQEAKGFYRMHIHLDALKHEFDEDDIFAMGGNTQAVLSGLADENQARRIIENALERQKTYGVSTISGTLLPPYPKGFFRHPLLDDPYEYQNGGQWDWFGGRLICAMFEHGFSREAKEKLEEIIRKNLNNCGFFEWDTREGTGRGSDFYCGSAGSLGKALFEGYFGIKIRKYKLSLEPRLGEDTVKVHVHWPTTTRFLAYTYEFDKEHQTLVIDLNSNLQDEGKIKILLPWIRADQEEKTVRKKLKVLYDGRDISFRLETKNQDVYICINSDSNHHLLEITLID